jgi:hypothetical protein
LARANIRHNAADGSNRVSHLSAGNQPHIRLSDSTGRQSIAADKPRIETGLPN